MHPVVPQIYGIQWFRFAATSIYTCSTCKPKGGGGKPPGRGGRHGSRAEAVAGLPEAPSQQSNDNDSNDSSNELIIALLLLYEV